MDSPSQKSKPGKELTVEQKKSDFSFINQLLDVIR